MIKNIKNNFMKNLLILFLILTTNNSFCQNDSTNKRFNDSMHKRFVEIIAKDSTKLLLPYLAPRELDSIVTAANTNNNNYYPNYSQQQYNHSLWLSIALLIFGSVVICGIFYILITQKKGWGPNAVQIVSITLLIVAGLFLITAGYSQQQITPIVGLLGTIAGYLLGKSSKE